MIGRVGTCFGEHGINIVSAAVGLPPDHDRAEPEPLAVMVITTASPVPRSVLQQIVASDGFVDGRTVSL
jgi:D-3-phosphoglycerate dehydrogenase / 2-oxoglutarate reductase